MGFKLSLILGVLLATSLAGSKYLFNQLSQSKANQMLLEGKITEQNDSIKQYLAKQEQLSADLGELEVQKQNALREVNKLRNTFAKHDLDNLALNKPGLIEKIVNKGSKQVMTDLVELTTVKENETSVYGAVRDSYDQDGDTITYSIDETFRDGWLFDIDATSGLLTFKEAATVDDAKDFDRNGSYLVEVTATSASDTKSGSMSITVSEDKTAPSLSNLSIDKSIVEGVPVISISGLATDNASGIERVQFRIKNVETGNDKWINENISIS